MQIRPTGLSACPLSRVSSASTCLCVCVHVYAYMCVYVCVCVYVYMEMRIIEDTCVARVCALAGSL